MDEIKEPKKTKTRKAPVKESAETVETAVDKSEIKPDRYYEAVGRRKTAIARVRLFTKGTGMTINDKEYDKYFPQEELRRIAESPLKKMKTLDKFKVTVKVLGGGPHGQAEAIRHGLSRSLVKFNEDFRKRLKKSGFLMRDPREKERKKYGLKGARRAPQWAKR